MHTLLYLLSGLSLGAGGAFLGTQWAAPLALIFCLLFSLLMQSKQPTSYFTLIGLGLVVHIVSLHWLPQTIEHFGGLPWYWSYLFSLLLFTAASLQFAAVQFCYRSLSNFEFLNSSQLALPLAWLCCEYFYPRFLPWSLGSFFIDWTPFVFPASIFGVSAVGGLFLWWSGLVLSCRAPQLALWFTSFALVGVLGQDSPLTSSFSVALVQANLDVKNDYAREKIVSNVQRHQALSQDADLIVWPESSVLYEFKEGEEKLNSLDKRMPLPGKTHLFGSQTRQAGTDKYYNSAILIDQERGLQFYHKQILFPFSERLPYPSLFSWLPKLISHEYLMTPGKSAQPISIGEIKLAIAICFEDLWPEIFLKQKASNVLIAITNDGWFGTSVAARQHHALASWRAVEFNRYLLRASNNGITAVVSPSGETVQELAPDVAEALYVKDVGILEVQTPYASWGDTPLRVISALILLIVILKRSIRITSNPMKVKSHLKRSNPPL